MPGEGARELVGRRQAGLRAVDHGHGDRPPEGDQRARRYPGQQIVEREDLRPVGARDRGGLAVHRGDRGLELVRAERAGTGQRPRDEFGALRDERPVPAGAVLLKQRDERAVRGDPGGPPGVGQHHEREQARGLGVVRHQPAQQPGQPDSLGGQVDPLQGLARGGDVALIEDQVQDVLDYAQPLAAVGPGRRGELGTCRADLLLGAADALRHRRLGHDEGPGDLRRAQPADGAQGECDLRRRGERGVTAKEQQGKGVVVVARAGRPVVR